MADVSSFCVFVSIFLMGALAAPTKSPPDLGGLESWGSVGHRSICQVQVAYDAALGLEHVWCEDDVEGRTFLVDGEQYECKSVRHTVPFMDSDVDVAGGCVALRARREPPPIQAVELGPYDETRLTV